VGLIPAHWDGVGFHRGRLRDEAGYPLSRGQLRSRFYKARELAKIPKEEFQFRDLRARSVTRKVIADGLEEGQRLAGHSGPGMTAHYSRGSRPVSRQDDGFGNAKARLKTSGLRANGPQRPVDIGAGCRTRTRHLMITNQLLYQMS
jgi:hypothetical protein